ncbi:MAG: 50S ribosomal protein L15 [Gammaproteobacteria bacterium]|nr:50S ribosomal protein L15 [Gammaproteobacteria bacterium]
MRLNTISPAEGSKKAKVRLGRGIGSGLGKTSGKGHKGQKARAGGYHRRGFEGGQNPLQRRLPKFGFKSRVGLHTIELRASKLNKLENLENNTVTLESLIAANLVAANTKFVKIIAHGEITKSFNFNHTKTIRVSKGAKEQITAAGGSVQEETETA